MNSDALKAFLRKVVQEEIPEELEAFDVSAQTLFDRASQAKTIEDLTRSERVSFEFGEGALAVMEFISLLWGTIEATKEIVRIVSSGTENFDDLREKWRLELEEAGLSKPKAERISKRFVMELRDVIHR